MLDKNLNLQFKVEEKLFRKLLKFVLIIPKLIELSGLNLKLFGSVLNFIVQIEFKNSRSRRSLGIRRNQFHWVRNIEFLSDFQFRIFRR